MPLAPWSTVPGLEPSSFIIILFANWDVITTYQPPIFETYEKIKIKIEKEKNTHSQIVNS